MQLTYNTNPPMGRAGMLATLENKRTHSRTASGLLAAGLMAFIVPGEFAAPADAPDPGPSLVWQAPTPASPAALATAVMTSHATVDAGFSVSGATLNGATGGGVISPPRKGTVTLTNHADFDADANGVTWTYVDSDGVTRSEVLAVADAGNATLTTTRYIRQTISVAFSATMMAGTGGAITVGYAALDASITAPDFAGIVMYDSATVESTYGADTRTADYVDGSTVQLLRTGSAWVVTEDTCLQGGAVYCRVAGTGTLGAFRSDTDSGNAVLVPNARWARNSAAGLNIVELYS